MQLIKNTEPQKTTEVKVEPIFNGPDFHFKNEITTYISYDKFHVCLTIEELPPVVLYYPDFVNKRKYNEKAEPRYSAKVILHKEIDLYSINIIQQAIKQMIPYFKNKTDFDLPKYPGLYDGDVPSENGEIATYKKNHLFFTLNTYERPALFNNDNTPMRGPEEWAKITSSSLCKIAFTINIRVQPPAQGSSNNSLMIFYRPLAIQLLDNLPTCAKFIPNFEPITSLPKDVIELMNKKRKLAEDLALGVLEKELKIGFSDDE